MIYFILYLAIDGDFSQSHPYHFSTVGSCKELGQIMVTKHRFEAYRCVKELQ